MIFAAVAALTLGSGCGPTEAKTVEGLRAAEADWVVALERRDVPRLTCRLAPDFVDTNWQGRLVDRKTVLRALPTRASSTLQLTCIEPEIHGEFGLVRGLNTQRSDNGQLIGAVRFTDVFVYRLGRWMALSAQETPTSTSQCAR